MGVSFQQSMTENHAQSSATTFSFQPNYPYPTLSFPLPSRAAPPRKRYRSQSDVDATNIVDRGSSKIAVWAKQKALGRNLLRKAAIMNYIRLRRTVSQVDSQAPRLSPPTQEMIRQTFMYGSPDTYTHPVVRPSGDSTPVAVSPNFTPGPALVRGPSFSREPSPGSSSKRAQAPSPQVPRRDYIPLPPSPLGLSNYDALDTEDEFSDDEEGGCDWFSGTRADSFGDFDTLDPDESVVDDHDNIEAFASPEAAALMGVGPGAEPHGMHGRVIAAQEAEIQHERQRQRNFAFVRFEH